MERLESELKLAIAAEALSRVTRVRAVAEIRSGRGRGQRLTSTYYDTPDRQLRRAGITVRLRRAGRVWIQTVKDSGHRTSGLFQRREWEMAVPHPVLNRSHLLATGLDVLRDDDVLARLEAVFTTEVTRTTHILTTADWEIELALDSGRIVAADQTQPVAEIELELRRGPPSALFTLADHIAAALPCRVLDQSKSERGFMLADHTLALPVRAKAPALTAGTDVTTAFRIIAQSCLSHLSANDPALHGPDPAEAVHQMRVALRRLRSAIKVFKPILADHDLTTLRLELRWFLGHLGPVRDDDVLLAEIIDPVLKQHPDAPALTGLRRVWQDQRDQDFAMALAATADPRFARLLLRLGQWVTSPPGFVGDGAHATMTVEDFARKVLKRSHRKLLAAGGANLTQLPAEHLHQVRILGKQMRYAAEFFAALYPRGHAKPYLSLLGELQEHLGGINDLSVAGPRLARMNHRNDWAWAAGLIGGWHEARRAELLRQAQTSWKRLRKTAPFWR